jgi:hypothetical protein
MSKKIKPLLHILLLVLVTRAAIFFIAYGSYVYSHNQAPGFIATLRGLWDRWDANHYLYLAQHGYSADPEKAFYVVFGPLYPWLTRLSHAVIPDYFLSSLAVSLLGLAAACAFLYKLVRLDHDEACALRAVKYLLIWPFSFFLNAPFTESTFLAFFILGVYLIRTERWGWAGLTAMLAVLARPSVGNLMLVVLTVEYFLDSRVHHAFKNRLWGESLQLISKRLAVAAGLAAGTLVFLSINYLATLDPFTFMALQKTKWFHQYVFIWDNLKDMFNYARGSEPGVSLALWTPGLAVLAVTTALGLMTLKRLRTSYTAFLFVFILYIYSISWTISAARYMTAVFPLYIALALISKRKDMDDILTVVSAMLLAFYTFVFTHGTYLM